MAKSEKIDMDGTTGDEGTDQRGQRDQGQQDQVQVSARRPRRQPAAEPERDSNEGQSDPQGGDGPGGREWVEVAFQGNLVKRRPRRGDEVRPRCPRCSTEEVAVLCGAQGSTDMVTNYSCPHGDCNFHVPKLRPGVAQNLKAEMLSRQQRRQPFVDHDR